MRHLSILREFDPGPGVAVAALAYEYDAGTQISEHAHGSDQLIYAISGVMEVISGRSAWTLPPQFSLWIPALTVHRVNMTGEVRMRTLYFRRGTTVRTPHLCSLLYVSPLLRELIIEAVRCRRLRMRNRKESALAALLSGYVADATTAPIGPMMMPSEPRALALAQRLTRDLVSPNSLASVCAEMGIGLRTVQRIFLKELGIDIETWRRQLRLTRAVHLLVAGCSVKEVAFAVGYGQPSAFVEAFRRLFGSTPKAWAASLMGMDSFGDSPQQDR